MSLGCIIISNSDDLRFLRAGIKQISPVCQQVVVSIGTKLWNGEDEDENKIEEFAAELPSNVRIVRYRVPEDKAAFMCGSVCAEMYWEGHARWTAFREMGPVDYLLILDSDEVVDGESLNEWLTTGEHTSYVAMKLRNYWYWREPVYKAVGYYEDSAVVVKNGSFNPMHLFSNLGRHGVFESAKGTKIRDVSGVDGLPMVHHYSWVRNKEEMLRKVRAWGHRSDRADWESLVEEEFSRPFNGTDFLKGLSYETVRDPLIT